MGLFELVYTSLLLLQQVFSCHSGARAKRGVDAYGVRVHATYVYNELYSEISHANGGRWHMRMYGYFVLSVSVYSQNKKSESIKMALEGRIGEMNKKE